MPLQIKRPGAQRRHGDTDHVEPVKEILAKRPRLDGRAEVAVGGGDHAHICGARLGLADALICAFLQEPQQLWLKLSREFANLIEKERAPARRLNLAPRIGRRTGEGAFHMTEEFALQQLARQARAAHGHKWAARERAALVDVTCECTLARAVFAQNEDVCPRARRPLDDGHDALHLGILGGEVGGRGGMRNLLFQVVDPLMEPARFLDAREKVPQLLRGERLLEVIVGATTHGLDGRRDARVRRAHDHREIGREFQQARQGIEPVRLTLQMKVEQDEIVALLLELEHGDAAGVGRLGLMPLGLYCLRRGDPNGSLVVNNQDAHGFNVEAFRCRKLCQTCFFRNGSSLRCPSTARLRSATDGHYFIHLVFKQLFASLKISGK